MGKRKCAYTGQESECTDKALYKDFAEEEIHNWTNSIPCSISYKESKKDLFPTDIEAEIHETFYLLEIYKWKVKYLEKKLSTLQEKNNSRTPTEKTGVAQKNKEKKKQKEIESAIAIKEIAEDNESKIDTFLENKKRSIF